MTQRVFENSMVAHVWAQQNQEEGRSNNGNFYFRGATIYSYGSHFPIASFVEHGRGKRKRRAILFNMGSYSSSTSRHQCYTRSAVDGLGIPVFQVDDPCNLDPRATVKEYRERIKGLFMRAARARSNKPYLLDAALSLIDDANAFCKFYGLRYKIKSPEDSTIAGLLDDAAKQAKKDLEKHREMKRQRAAQAVLDLEAWRAGTLDHLPWNSYARPESPAMRVRGDNVETSMGARFTIAEAKTAWPFILRCKERGQVWQSNGGHIPIGEFSISRIDDSGNVRAGCHFVKFAEVESVARTLGLLS